jgi:multidrug efflux pump subunit AcrA (membrane-fusion protein)
MNFFKSLINRLKLFLKTTFVRITSFRDYLQPKFTRVIEGMIPDEDIAKTSILFWFMCSFVIIAIIWGSLARIDKVVRSQGEVIPASKVKVIQSVFGGVIEKINIKLGDSVKKDDILFVIDGVRSNSDFLSNELSYEATLLEVETREKKVELIDDLVKKGAEAEMRLLEEKLSLVDSQRRLAQLESQRAALQQQKDQTTIRAPYDGIINDVYITTEGEVVQSAQLLANLVPDNEKLIILARVLPKDISFVHVGQKAKLSFSAFDPSVYGTFDGTVIKVAATTSTAGEKKETSYYDTRIIVDETSVNKILIQSGMMVDISMVGQKRTVLGYIFDPVTKITRQAFREK